MAYVKKLKPVSYNPETGEIIGARGKPWSAINSAGYVIGKFMGKTRTGHHVAWYLTYGYFPRYLDHINQVRHDNRLSNLREATESQNMMNKTKHSNNRSGYKNVSFDSRSGKWLVVVKRDFKQYRFGLFEDVDEAGRVAEKARNEIHKEYTSS